jgi:hypothetical protein
MNYVMLGSKSNEFYVTDDAYQQIVALIQAQKCCLHDYHNRHPYTEANPCVGKNICLEHVLQKQKSLVYAGLGGADSSNRLIYRFLDAKGMMYTFIEDYSDEARQSIDETLAYYEFTPPVAILSRGKEVNFYSYYATLYGDLHSASVIVLSYNQYTEKVRGLFLLYKNAPSKELSKKNELYRRAEELVEANKDPQGQYHINGHIRASRYEADVYEVISQLESALYDVTRKLQTKLPAEETHGEEPVRQDSDA